MTPVKQEKKDDCLRACVASLLDKPLAEVPHFCEGVEEVISDLWVKSLFDYLESIGKEVVVMDVGYSSYYLKPEREWIAIGKNNHGAYHAVVMRGEELVHNPAKYSDGFVSVSVIIVIF